MSRCEVANRNGETVFRVPDKGGSDGSSEILGRVALSKADEA